MILLINTCKEEMHYLEFVRPIEDILKRRGIRYMIKHHSALDEKSIDDAEKIIICGTSLRDFSYLEGKEKFGFIKRVQKPILGICGGMQLIAEAFGCTLTEGREIGLKKIIFEKEFITIKGERDVYCLHNMCLKDDSHIKNIYSIFKHTVHPGNKTQR